MRRSKYCEIQINRQPFAYRLIRSTMDMIKSTMKNNNLKYSSRFSPLESIITPSLDVLAKLTTDLTVSLVKLKMTSVQNMGLNKR